MPWASNVEAATSSCRTRLRHMACCSSSSVGMGGLAFCVGHERAGTGRLLEQNAERRNIIVPFDQGWNRTEARERLPIERPHLLDDARAMIVDAQDRAVGERPDG